MREEKKKRKNKEKKERTKKRKNEQRKERKIIYNEQEKEKKLWRMGACGRTKGRCLLSVCEGKSPKTLFFSSHHFLAVRRKNLEEE